MKSIEKDFTDAINKKYTVLQLKLKGLASAYPLSSYMAVSFHWYNRVRTDATDGKANTEIKHFSFKTFEKLYSLHTESKIIVRNFCT